MDIPPHMLTTPHTWQLKGAAQVHYLSKTEFRGAIVEDQMGLGKTLLAILAMYLAREESGSPLLAGEKQRPNTTIRRIATRERLTMRR